MEATLFSLNHHSAGVCRPHFSPNLMPKSDYMPNDDEGKARLFVRFRDGIGQHLPALGVAADDPQIVQQAADATRFRALLDFALAMQHSAKVWTSEKDHERDGKSGNAANLSVPALGDDFPPPVPPGIVSRFRKLVKRLKHRPGYNEAWGKLLGIEGAENIMPDLTKVRPGLEAKLNGDRVEVLWGWQALSDWVDSVELEVERGEGKGFTFLTRDTVPGYIDKTALPTKPTTWRYRGIYWRRDNRVGEWSAVAKVNLGE